mmetsp:Transcript_21958/g.44648  ORF Transcript_21958/g.44648 Transcript_21958/m.44648 type:complete len:289 (-) Transcript_21958:452-1318(-)
MPHLGKLRLPIQRNNCQPTHSPPPTPRHSSCFRHTLRSDEVGEIHGHLVDLCGVVLLDVAKDANVVGLDEVDGDALAPVAAGAANAVDVELAVVGEVVVDDERDLRHVEPAGPDIGGDEDAGGARAELLHDGVAVVLRHVAVHRRHREVRLAHLVCQPVHLPLRIAEDDRLRDGQRVVEVAQRVKLPLLALHRHKELLDALQRQLVALHQDPHRVRHELLRHLQHLPRQRCRDQQHLDLRRQVAVHVIDLLLETLVQHLVRLVQHQRFDVPRPQVPPPDHIKHPSRCA